MSRPTANVLIAVLAIMLISCLPILSVWLSASLASGLGCELDEGSVHPCQFHGIELGGTLNQMYVLGWLGIATIPLGVIAIGVLLLGWIIASIYRRLKRQGTTG